jgi:type 1 fimbria pilin
MNVVSKVIFLVLMLVSTQAFCECYSSTTLTKSFRFANIVVQRDVPIGTTIGTVNSPGTDIKTATCNGGAVTEYDQMMYLGGVATAISGVYQTNIPGVGISGDFGGSRWPFNNPPGTWFNVTNNALQVDAYYGQNFQLIKTGNITSGSLLSGLAARVYYSGTPSIDAIDLYIGSSTVTQVACSITTPSLTFPIGDILASTFGTTVGTTPTAAKNTQNLGLNCDAQANINVSLSGTQNPDVSTTSVLALTGQGSAGVAKGVGVQILYNSAPLILNNRIVLKQSSGGQETFPLTARYYQTKTSVSTGSANSSATLNLTYQ